MHFSGEIQVRWQTLSSEGMAVLLVCHTVLLPYVRYQGVRLMAPISQLIFAQMICVAPTALAHQHADVAAVMCTLSSTRLVGASGAI